MLKSEAMKRVIALAALYPNAKTTPEMFDAYAGMLSHLTPEVLNAACEQVAIESKFFPTVAEILKFAPTVFNAAEYVDDIEYLPFEFENRERTPEETAAMVSDDRKISGVPTRAQVIAELNYRPVT